MARHFVFKALIECFMVCTLAVPAAAQHPMICIKAGTFFDGASSELRHNVVILIQDSRIVDVGERLKPPEGATVINLSTMTVMPGLIDAHTHITLHPGDYDSETLRETPEFRAIYGTRTASITLDAGITSIRDVGNEGAGLADIALRDAINKGIVPGPRILTAIQPTLPPVHINLWDTIRTLPFLRSLSRLTGKQKSEKRYDTSSNWVPTSSKSTWKPPKNGS